ncbi:hypothetical protein SAMN04488063_2820 [Halopelagius inordinatus]|uniref:Glycosyltransferase 2-like domain-containing protein n=1 Tax=Halopelagius inordinatus TaxID=553467 RepID=A0A1I2U7Z2_9EURY|nr:glycosyltransferase family 2 protein [Halopelagius inordinatus]SFG73285.1 hypothetical protein SAMN04488063_2820 [Halopelagius inordinatus]
MGRLLSRDRTKEEEYPLVGIVVLTWENYEDTAECLESIRSVAYPNFETIVVDNGSADGSRERLVEEFDWCTFVLNDENRGFAGGNNPGIACALSRGVDYVLLLNNDTVVEPDFLTPLVETAEKNEDVVGVGGVEYRAGSDEILRAGGKFYPYLGGRVTPVREVEAETPYETNYVPSSLLLLDGEFVETNDVLHEGYFLGMDDVDVAVQARKQGKRMFVDPRSTIHHKEGMTGDRSPFMTYHWMRNRLQFASMRLTGLTRGIFYLMFALTVVQFSLIWIARRRGDLLRSTYYGVADHARDGGFRSYEFFG